MFGIGTCSGEITNFTATPEYAQITDDIAINMTFENTGTVNITGSARIKVVNSSGEVIGEFVHDVNELSPSESVSFSDIWNVSEAGPCKILGYVLYDSKATEPVVVEINKAECFPADHSTYNDWVTLGKPDCWCAPPYGSGYQCDGDADGKTETVFKYRIYGGDLNLIIENWKRTIEDPLLNPCADIDHKAETVFKYRVYGRDLATVVTNWKKNDAQLPGNCPRWE